MTQAGDMLGTPQYMAPEQIRGEAIDGRTDIYALGCMIYEMITARLPYEAPTIMAMLSKHLIEPVMPPSQRRPDLIIPPAVDQLVVGAMAKDAAARPPTMDLFSELLQALLASLPPDPNRSAGMSVQQSVATPRYPTPPTFPPPSTPPPAFAAHAAAVSTPVPSTPVPTLTSGPRSNLPIWIILGVLAVGGAGAGIWFATRGDDTKPAAKPDPWDQPQPAADPDDGSDEDSNEGSNEPVDNWDTPAPRPPEKDPWGP
jgi:serine/threonine-protein kinase